MTVENLGWDDQIENDGHLFNTQRRVTYDFEVSVLSVGRRHGRI